MTALRVSHLSDSRQVANAVNTALRKTDALSLSSDQSAVLLDRNAGVTGNFDVTGFYTVAGVQVVGARVTGWTVATGTPSRGAFAAIAAGTASGTYVQSELQAALNRIAALEARVIALQSDITTHGLIGA